MHSTVFKLWFLLLLFIIWGTLISQMATTYTGWDAQMNFLLANNRGGPNYDRFGSGLRGNRTEIFPLLSRSNNIGMEVNLSKE